MADDQRGAAAVVMVHASRLALVTLDATNTLMRLSRPVGQQYVLRPNDSPAAEQRLVLH